MVNNSTNKFDDKIKDVLDNYQADFVSTDWDRMENKLNNSSSSKKINSKYIIYSIIAIAIIGGAYFLFNAIDWSASNEPKKDVKEYLEPVTPPVVEKEIETLPVVIDTASNPSSSDTIIESEPVAETEKEVIVEKEKTETAETEKTTSPKAKTEKTKKKEKNKSATNTDDGTKPETIFTMGNEPVFGDMLDSSKGIIRVTKEKDETKKAAQSKSDVPVGWNQFMLKNVNVDSLRSYRAKKDSIQ